MSSQLNAAVSLTTACPHSHHAGLVMGWWHLPFPVRVAVLLLLLFLLLLLLLLCLPAQSSPLLAGLLTPLSSPTSIRSPEAKTCPAPNRHMGKRPFFPLFPVYRDADSSGFSLSLPGTEDGGEGEREMQPCAKPGGSQSHPGAPLNVHADCHHVHTGQRERVACLESGVVSGSWPCEGLSPPAWCSSWRRCKMAGKSPWMEISDVELVFPARSLAEVDRLL